MNRLSRFDIDKIISYCDLKSISRLQSIIKNVVLSTVVIYDQHIVQGYEIVSTHRETMCFVFERGGLTIFTAPDKFECCGVTSVFGHRKFRLDCDYGYKRVIGSNCYANRYLHDDTKSLYKYLNTIFSILLNTYDYTYSGCIHYNSIDSKLKFCINYAKRECIELIFQDIENIDGRDRCQYIGVTFDIVEPNRRNEASCVTLRGDPLSLKVSAAEPGSAAERVSLFE
jgi:hypothetical protein